MNYKCDVFGTRIKGTCESSKNRMSITVCQSRSGPSLSVQKINHK